MEDRLARLEARLDRLEKNDTELMVQGARTEAKVDSILHWMHNGGNTEGRLRRLEQWRSFIVGALALANIVGIVALAVFAGR